jgi:spermidine/putrescine transport system substrate-binding protein
MRIINNFLLSFLLLLICLSETHSASDYNKIINIYGWSDIIPDAIFRQFEKETGIKVNFSTYDNNEVMYAKLRASPNPGYDLIQPSSYYIERMRRQKMLEILDKSKLVNFKNINPEFLNHDYDPKNQYSIPYDWGLTGIFYNKDYHSAKGLNKWADLWGNQFENQLMLLDDSREVFSMALLALHYSPNDTNPEHIKQAYLKLKQLMPNIKIFNSEAVISVLIDEDVTIGMAWNGDVYKASRENSNLGFIFPEEGFVIWVDSFAIPKKAPHLNNAYAFLNFIMRPDVAAAVALYNNYPTTNLAAQKMLPKAIRENSVVYPSHAILAKGQYQRDIDDEILALYEKYWEQLKIGG